MAARAYLDYAGLGCLRPAAVRAMRTAVEEVLPYGSAEIGPLFGARSAARRHAAALLDCDPDEVALVPNTSAGIHLVADGLDWQPGDQVVLFDRDFPANVRPWQRLTGRGVTLRWVPMRDGGYQPDDIAAAIGPATRLIAVSHVNFATGFRCDLDQVCALAAGRGALVCVDAVQSLGVLPLSVAQTPVDFVAAGAHKWLCGPPGTGVFYCRRSRLDLLRWAPSGWYGFEGAAAVSSEPGSLRYDLPERASAVRFEGGMYNIAGIAGLAESLAELTAAGLAAVSGRALQYADRIRDGLTGLGYRLACTGPGARSAVVSVACPEPLYGQVLTRLAAAGVCVSSPDGLIRVSPHYWTRPAEIDLFLAEMAAAASPGRG
jgi:cysteine desulfurase/selenocysteine lyase